jgi:hypothetical protein
MRFALSVGAALLVLAPFGCAPSTGDVGTGTGGRQTAGGSGAGGISGPGGSIGAGGISGTGGAGARDGGADSGQGGTSGSGGSRGSGGATGLAGSSGEGGLTASGGTTGSDGGAGATGMLAATPPMGWNSWNTFQCNITEALIKQIADTFVSSGMQAVGYQYVNVDDCWMDGRDASGNLRWNATKFPSGIPALADYVHAKGLKLGIYETPNTRTCVGIYGGIAATVAVGSLGHEKIGRAHV